MAKNLAPGLAEIDTQQRQSALSYVLVARAFGDSGFNEWICDKNTSHLTMCEHEEPVRY